MKKIISKLLLICFIVLSLTFTMPIRQLLMSSKAKNNSTNPLIAIVIDDFGSLDRNGVEEMLSLKIPLTCAVMPGLENTINDSERAHALGHEVILHMPMEAQITLPQDWYGPFMIKNADSEENAIKTIEESFKSVPHAVGMNIHIGTGVSRNQKLLSAIMKYLKTRDLYFLDSKTIEDTACGISAARVDFPLMTRDVFLEHHTNHSYGFAIDALNRAKKIALEKGFAIVIGHVGPEGGHNTYKAISDMIASFESSGIRLVKLSEIYKLAKESV